MAYQPKFAAGKSGRSVRPSREGAPARQPVSRPLEQKKAPPRPQLPLAVRILLGIVAIPLGAFLTWQLLLFTLESVGRPRAFQPAPVADQAILAGFDGYLTAQLDSAQAGLLSQQAPTVPETEPPRIQYEIPADAAAAPKPDPGAYGESSDPVQLNQVLEEAAWLLKEDPVYFDPARERFADGPVKYYLDDSILALTWKEVHDGAVYTFSEVKLSHPSQFRRHLAGNEYGSQMQFLTTEMAQTVNAVVASGGDFYRFREFGAVVYQGKARRVEGTYAETCYIDVNGDMHFTYGGEVLTVEQVQAFVDQHNISFSLAFGPVLVDNGQPVEHTWYGVGEINEGYARAALCQMAPLHYLVVTANVEGDYQDVPTVAAFAEHIIATGCVNAYCLDGGQTASIVMGGELINRPVKGQQRKISDIIYFATAVPEGG